MNNPLVRAEGYRLLALTLTYPDPDELTVELLGAANAPDPLPDFARLATQVDGTLPGEFNRLFATNVAVSPYETSWIRADKGASLGQLAALYAAFGARIAVDHPDHIGALLEFASLLCLKEALAETPEQTEVCRQAQRVLLQEHLGSWGPIFSVNLAEGTSSTFYASVAVALRAWLQADLDSQGWAAEAADINIAGEDPDCMTCPMAKGEA